MRTQKYIVKLSEEEVVMLQEIVSENKPKKQKVKRAKILLELDYLRYHPIPNKFSPQEVIANRCGVSTSMVYQISKKFNEKGLEATLNRKERETPAVPSIVTGDIEARIIAMACGKPPEGYSRWTIRLLEDKVVELGIVDKISDTTIHRLLKKRNLNLI